MRHPSERVKSFLACCFHQDWAVSLPQEDFRVAVRSYVGPASREETTALLSELSAWLADPTSPPTAASCWEAGCYFDPAPDGHSEAEWIGLVRDEVASCLAAGDEAYGGSGRPPCGTEG